MGFMDFKGYRELGFIGFARFTEFIGFWDLGRHLWFTGLHQPCCVDRLKAGEGG